MAKVTTSTYLTANLELKTVARVRDEKGRFIKGESPKTYKPKSLDVARILEKKAQSSTSIKQFQSKIRYTLGEKSDDMIKKGYHQLLDNVVDSGIGDKDLAKFFLVMNDLGPYGLDDFYDKYSNFLDNMYDYYNVHKDDEITFIGNRKQKMQRVLNGEKDVSGFFSRAGYTDKELEDRLTKIAYDDFKRENPDYTDDMLINFQSEINNDPDFIYRNYLNNHYNDVYNKVSDIKGKGTYTSF